MNVADITIEDVEAFFNKYKFNSEQIFHLERRMIQESYVFSKWEELRLKNSITTRKYFAENEQLLDDWLRPAIISPELLNQDVCETYLRHILFFLFENNIDLHLCEDFPRAILRNEEKFSDLIRFEAYLGLAISLTMSGNSTFEEVNELFNKAWKFYPTFNSCPDDNVRIHLAIGYNYHFFAFVMYHSDNYSSFLKLYNNFERIMRFGTDSLYSKMWSGSNDFQYHIELILRHIRCFGIFAAGLNGYGYQVPEHQNEENIVALNNIASWTEREYQEEETEGRFNPMVYTYYYKWLNRWGRMDFYSYHNRLLDLFNKAKIKPFTYEEASFPQDDDPVDPQFAGLMSKMKIFSDSFTSVYVLFPELFEATQEEELKYLISGLISGYYHQCKYAAKGFSEDNFIIQSVIKISSIFRSAKEFITYVNNIFVHRQISSAIHFSMVQNLVTICATRFITSNPELFIVPGVWNTTEEVILHRKEILDFLKNGAALHDIGKLGVTNIVNLHYRKITSGEFALIKRHPDFGALIAESVPYISAYKDIIIGHHKFWDGVDGYPKEFENCYSKYRNYIGLVTICDCVDTSTDSQGRNYAKIKTFDDILQELQADAGRRYNEKFVELISSDEGLKDELRYATTSARKFTSYKTYNEYIQPNTTFAKEDEKDICVYKKEFHDSLIEFYKNCHPEKESELANYVTELIESPDNKTLVIVDQKSNVYGIITGRIVNNSEKLPRDFNVDEIIVSPNYRRKGFATELISASIEMLKPQGVDKLKITYTGTSGLANFFWIQGFVPAPDGTMEKSL